MNTIAPGRNILLEPMLGAQSVLLAKDDDHLRRRKLMLPPFHGERMRAYESVIEEATQRQMERWPSGERFPLHPSMQALTLEVILRAVFGVEDARPPRRAQRAPGRDPGDDAVAPRRRTRYPAPAQAPALAPHGRADRAHGRAPRGGDRAPGAPTPTLAEREDILSMLVAARFDDGSAMDDRDIRDQLMTLLLAGHETTATSLAWAFDQLFHRPDAMERLREEVAGRRDGVARRRDQRVDAHPAGRPVHRPPAA